MSSPSKPKVAGVLCPVFALRAAGDDGIGDVRALRELVDWAADCGLGFVQVLPVNATGNDPSPYNAISSVALDPLTLDLRPEAVPELAADAARDREAEAGIDSDPCRVDYPRARRIKLGKLRAGFAGLFQKGRPKLAKRRREFEAFWQRERAWLDDFCLFRVLMERHGHEDWTLWGGDCNTAEKARAWRSENAGEVEPEMALHAYAQWLCHQQWQAAREHALSRGVRLMGDVPFGVSYCSADVFFNPGQFNLDWCGGAPPETYFKDDLFVQKWGQNWGIPLYRWDVMEADGFSWWRQRIRKQVEIFDLFRIDHVLGFYRIYSFPWRPARNEEFLPLNLEEAAALAGGNLPRFIERDDDTAEGCAANLAQGDKFLRMILDAAGEAGVIAEDLGTVPPYVRPHLASLDIPGFKICQWETSPDGKAIAGSDYPECSFATYATHDHAPMRVHWKQRRAEAAGEDDEARQAANHELRVLTEFAGLWEREGQWTPYNDGIRRALLEALLASNARYACFMLNDLLGLDLRFNVPGIAGDMNWSARFPVDAAELAGCSPWREESAWLREALARNARTIGR